MVKLDLQSENREDSSLVQYDCAEISQKVELASGLV